MQENNQLKEFQQAFVAIKHNVSDQDRKDAEEALTLSRWSVSEYLNGRGYNLHTAENLLKFFKARIADRNDLLQSVKSSAAA